MLHVCEYSFFFARSFKWLFYGKIAVICVQGYQTWDFLWVIFVHAGKCIFNGIFIGGNWVGLGWFLAVWMGPQFSLKSFPDGPEKKLQSPSPHLPTYPHPLFNSHKIMFSFSWLTSSTQSNTNETTLQTIKTPRVACHSDQHDMT